MRQFMSRLVVVLVLVLLTPVVCGSVSSEMAATKAINDLRIADSVIVLTNPRHSAAWTRSGVRFKAQRGPSWEWSLGSVRVGTASVDLARDVAPSADGGLLRVDYDRGALIERYFSRRDSVEQQFVIAHRLSTKAGDLVIEGSVRSSGTFATTNAGWVWSEEEGVVSLGQLKVFDRNGALLPARMDVDADCIRLTVNGEALLRAAYPVTIDPEIGTNDFRISFAGPDGNTSYSALNPAVAYNSTDHEYLVVWVQTDATPESEIYGQRINETTGALIGSSIRISDMGPDGNASYNVGKPAVAYNSANNEYLVVWQGDDNVGTLVQDETEIFGQRLNAATGGTLGTNDFRISNMGLDSTTASNGGGECFAPDVAYNSTNNEYLVVWDGTQARSERVSEIWGQRIDAATGAEVGTNDFRILDYNPGPAEYRNAFQPRVAYNSTNNEYLVVWHGEDLIDNETDIFGQRLNAATGAQAGATDFQISDMGPAGNTGYRGDQPDVAYNPVANEYLVVWSGSDDTIPTVGEKEIFAQRINAATGAAAGTNDFRISDMGPDTDLQFEPASPAVTYSGGEYLVVWSSADTTAFATEVYGQRLNTLGAQLGTNDFRLSDMGASDTNANYQTGDSAVAAGSAGRSLVVWRADDDTLPLVNDEVEIFGQLFSGPSTATTTITASPTAIAADGSSTSTITVQVKDATDGNFTTGGSTVALLTTLGTLGTVTDNNNGTYAATLTSSATPGTATISGTLNGLPISDTATVAFQFGPPTNLLATPTGITQVSLTWSAVGGATGYDVYRASVIPTYSFLVSTATPAYVDNGVLSGDRTYVYIVRATKPAVNSTFSAPDAATMTVFTDVTLNSTIMVKATHLAEIRRAVNAMRTAAGLTPVSFAAVTAGTTLISAVHITDLRTALDTARSAIGLPALGYTDLTLTPSVTAVKALHFTQLRARTQ